MSLSSVTTVCYNKCVVVQSKLSSIDDDYLNIVQCFKYKIVDSLHSCIIIV